MREIGSEFWDVPVNVKSNTLFPETTQWYLSGRCALQAIVTDLGEAKTVSLPSWCCDSMIKPFADAGLNIDFYPVYWHDGVIQDIKLNSDVLFLIDYFGFRTNTIDLSDYKGIVIRDVTHSIFSASYSDANYYFGSLRKWCGVWTGGFAWARDGHILFTTDSDNCEYVNLRKKAMQQKSEYIEGLRRDKGYLRIFEEAEDVLERIGIVPAAEQDVTLAKHLNIKLIKNRRKNNAEVLRKAFPEWLMFPISSSNDTPMFVPVLVPDGKRNDLRQHLIKNEIYCPVHWPVSEYHKLDEWTEYIYQNELSLVCDQRYTEEDMKRMVETIKMFMEK